MKVVRKMPVQASVHPHTDTLIRAAAEERGVSVSELLRDILEGMFPPLEVDPRQTSFVEEFEGEVSRRAA